jgi:hypothetical protein
MKNPKLDPANVARWLQNLSNNAFVEFFNEHLTERHIYRAEARSLDSHLVLANAVRPKGEKEWRLQLLCAAPDQNWGDDVPVCQFGSHCGHETASVSKTSKCPICGGDASGS